MASSILKLKNPSLNLSINCFSSPLAKPCCSLYSVVCLANYSLFAALGSCIISFANSTMFLAEEKERLYSATKYKTILSICVMRSESGMFELTGDVFSANMNALYVGCKPKEELEVDWPGKERFIFFKMFFWTGLC